MRLLILFLILSTNVQAQEESHVTKSIVELSTMADMQCINIMVLGICPKPSREIPVGIKVQYWQPEVFMETVKMPGDYTILEYGVALTIMAKTATQTELETVTGAKSLKVTSGGSSSSLSSSNMQFNEVHLYDYPLSKIFDTVLCSDIPNETLGIRYLSEADSIAWRRGDLEKGLPQSLVGERVGAHCNDLGLGSTPAQCMKSWGPLYPREGFVVVPGQPVGSVIDSLRSVSIAGNPLPAHIVEAKLDFQPNIPIDKVQMVYPQKTSCMAIGQNLSQWEQNKQSKDGHYVWIYWHRRECCI